MLNLEKVDVVGVHQVTVHSVVGKHLLVVVLITGPAAAFMDILVVVVLVMQAKAAGAPVAE